MKPTLMSGGPAPTTFTATPTLQGSRKLDGMQEVGWAEPGLAAPGSQVLPHPHILLPNFLLLLGFPGYELSQFPHNP